MCEWQIEWSPCQQSSSKKKGGRMQKQGDDGGALYTVEGMLGSSSQPTEDPQQHRAMLKQMRADMRGDRRTYDVKWRKKQLRGLLSILTDHRSELHVALQADLGLSPANAQMLEVDSAYGEAEEALRELDSWMKPKRKGIPLLQQPGSAQIVREPLGVVLIITPWNVPVQLTINAVVAAVSAGNACVVKPSEVSPNVSGLFSKLFPQYLDRDMVKVVEGGISETTNLLKLRWDAIHYTGNTFVGRIVMQAAAKFLTPVILELGGKNPVVVDSTADIDVCARRVVWAKFLNMGQLCTNCDYLMVDSSIKEKFVAAVLKAIGEFYGEDPRNSKDYSRIINERHVGRICSILESAEGHGEVLSGGLDSVNVKNRYIGPTVIALHNSVKQDAEAKRAYQEGKGKEPLYMREELFAPVLFIREYDDVQECYEFIDLHEKPLASYIFSSSSKNVEHFVGRVSSGGCGVNEIHMQVACSQLPFGGVGCSGMGAYHGKEGFVQLSHSKSVLRKATFGDPAFARYPPYTPFKIKMVYTLRYSLDKWIGYGKKLTLVLGVAYLLYVCKQKNWLTQILERLNF